MRWSTNNHWYVIADRTALFPTTQWRYVCFELFEKLRTQLNTEATQLTLNLISFVATSDEYWIDELSITANQREGQFLSFFFFFNNSHKAGH